MGEGLSLQVGDIDADRMRVQIRNAKGNRDRFVPLPENILQVLRRFWQTHRNPALLFPQSEGRTREITSGYHPRWIAAEFRLPCAKSPTIVV
ncbi:MAG: tyrosine-type recombinase/integrase [Ferrovum myxofaciens]|nr:tyrosine-type recombinase/integrase [Ferrovum myxofaciens]